MNSASDQWSMLRHNKNDQRFRLGVITEFRKEIEPEWSSSDCCVDVFFDKKSPWAVAIFPYGIRNPESRISHNAKVLIFYYCFSSFTSSIMIK